MERAQPSRVKPTPAGRVGGREGWGLEEAPRAPQPLSPSEQLLGSAGSPPDVRPSIINHGGPGPGGAGRPVSQLQGQGQLLFRRVPRGQPHQTAASAPLPRGAPPRRAQNGGTRGPEARARVKAAPVGAAVSGVQASVPKEPHALSPHWALCSLWVPPRPATQPPTSLGSKEGGGGLTDGNSCSPHLAGVDRARFSCPSPRLPHPSRPTQDCASSLPPS